MGNILSCCLDPRVGLCCACCRQKVASCCESETESMIVCTTAESATSDSEVAEVQYMQPVTNSKRRKGSVEALQDVRIKYLEEDEMPSDLEEPVAQYHHRSVEALQDVRIKYLEEDEMPSDLEEPVAQYHHRPVEILQDLTIEDFEEDEMPSDLSSMIAPNDYSPPEDDDESSSVPGYDDQVSMVRLSSWTEDEDLEKESLYKTFQERVRNWILESVFRPNEDDPQGQ
ncbi:uncharacterized protein C22orf42-like [Aotus nancymaae]|uniref:uncharacterized protein C22orf42-like n=1 Tax=Aotus nancymaae TaxID=37293 RepID=UPI0030FF0F01